MRSELEALVAEGATALRWIKNITRLSEGNSTARELLSMTLPRGWGYGKLEQAVRAGRAALRKK